jgi:hypothetical protein
VRERRKFERTIAGEKSARVAFACGSSLHRGDFYSFYFMLGNWHFDGSLLHGYF